MKIFIIIFLSSFASVLSFAQKNIKDTIAQEDIKDTIWFLNGERLISSRYLVDIEDGMLTYYNKRDKMKKVGLEYVFSIMDSKGNERIYFEATTIDNTYFTVEQMRSFVKGEYSARQGYKSSLAFASGVIAGAGAFYVVPEILHLNFFFSPLIPAANSTIIGSFNYKNSKVIKKYPERSDDKYFIAGYEEIATQKRITNSMKGGIVGIGLGIVSAIIIHHFEK